MTLARAVITQCCIHELYLQGKPRQSSVDLAKTFERRKCNHREAIPGFQCLLDVIGAYESVQNDYHVQAGATGDENKHRYVVATQFHDLRTRLRSIPAVPIIHINRSVMVLEPPSDVTLKTKQEV